MRSSLVVGVSFVALLASCAASAPPARPAGGVTSLQKAEAEDTGLEQTIAPPATAAAPVDPRTTQAVEALAARDYARVLALTEEPSSAWLESDRAAALAALGHTDEAVATFARAESRFADVGDGAGRADAVWGTARALAQAGRCREARTAYERYADLTRGIDPRSAAIATEYAAECRLVVRRR